MEGVQDEKRFWGLGEVLRLSIPASLSMLNPTVVRFVDGWMVAHLGGRLGPDSLSAQVTASMASMVPESLAMGLLGVVNTFVSQNLGAARFSRCGRYAWAGLWLAIAAAAIEASLAIFARPIFGLYGHEPAIRELEIMYFRYMVLAAFFTLPSRVLESFFYGIHRPGIVYFASTSGFVINLAAIYALIFGHWGFPRMGLQGAAVGSVLAWGVQLTMLAAIFLRTSFHDRFRTRWAMAVRWPQFRDLLRLGWPAGVSFCNDVLPWNFMLGYVAAFGIDHYTATSITWRYIPLSFMPAVGIGVATTALVGRYVGQGRPDLASRRCHAALAAAMVYMGLCGACFWLFGRWLIAAFLQLQGDAEIQQFQDGIIRIGGSVMICAAIFQLFDAVGIVYIGALRGAGETLWPMVLTIVLSWSFIVGGGAAMIHFAPRLASLGPWIAGSLYVIALGLVVAWRFERGAWQKIDLLGGGAQGEAEAMP